MEPADPERIRQLKLTAKWSADSSEKKQAISQLQQCGSQALPAIQEVLAVTAYDDVKQACIDAISALGMEQKKARSKAASAKRKKKGKHARK